MTPETEPTEPTTETPTPANRWWTEFSREVVRGQLEDATGEPLPMDSTLPDTLIAEAQAIGMSPVDLKLWIADDHPRADWSTANLRAWAERFGLTPPPVAIERPDGEAAAAGGAA